MVVHVSRAKNLTWSQIAPRLGLARSRPARSRLDMRLGIALGRSRARLGARRALLLLAASLFVPPEARFASACTNILVTPGASSDASAILAYNADSGSLYGSLGHYPATRNNPPNATREVWDWDDAVFLGMIPEARATFNVMGNANEVGLVIGETTFGGLPELDSHGSGGIMDYGNLIWIALQRCRTCREAIALIDRLVATHGYASDGESFSCVDAEGEAWAMELVGKGAFAPGAVWVATRVPDGAILAHANQARTTTFMKNTATAIGPEGDVVEVAAETLYSRDVVDFARSIGRYPADRVAFPDEDFDFSAAYDPITFSGARHGEARVWDIYRRVVAPNAMEPYLEYARGFDPENRMPLFAYPFERNKTASAASLSVLDVMALMRSRQEGSWFDPRGLTRRDVGAGPGHSAYRWRPLIWTDPRGGGGRLGAPTELANERTVATQQTSWTFVAPVRPWMPAPVAALQWWAPDDSGAALRTPVYGGATRVPYSLADRLGQVPNARAKTTADAPDADAFTPSLDSSFWVWNLVSNLAYGERADVVQPALDAELEKAQADLMRRADEMDAKLKSTPPAEAAEAATAFCEDAARSAHATWLGVFLRLFALIRDGFTVAPGKTPVCGDFADAAGASEAEKGGASAADRLKTKYSGCLGRVVPDTRETGYDDEWYARVADDGDNAEHYATKRPAKRTEAREEEAREARRLETHKRLRMNKRRRRSEIGGDERTREGGSVQTSR